MPDNMQSLKCLDCGKDIKNTVTYRDKTMRVVVPMQLCKSCATSKKYEHIKNDIEVKN